MSDSSVGREQAIEAAARRACEAEFTSDCLEAMAALRAALAAAPADDGGEYEHLGEPFDESSDYREPREPSMLREAFRGGFERGVSSGSLSARDFTGLEHHWQQWCAEAGVPQGPSVQVTDELVEIAAEAAWRAWPSDQANPSWLRLAVRAALVAALSPAREPGGDDV